MPAPRPQELIDLALKVVKDLQVKAVLCAGWSDINLQGLDDELRIVKSVAHDVLFPRCRVILHHAGIGTCAAALRAGVPSVCLPVMLDQFYNARHLQRLRVAKDFIPFSQVASSHDRVVQAVREALQSEDMKKEAVEIAEKLQTDGADECAEKILETYPVS